MQHIQEGTTLFLTAEQKAMWSEAGTTFTAKQLNQLMKRVLIDLTVDQPQNDFYELRRFDAPHVFDTLLKLQITGRARRHIELDKDRDEIREVLRVEARLFDLIMQAIAMILDVFLRVLAGALKAPSSRSTEPSFEPPWVSPIPPKYAPSRQRHQPRIEHDDGGYTP